MAKYLKRNGKRVTYQFNGKEQEVRIDTKSRTYVLNEQGKKVFVTIPKAKKKS